MSSCGMQRLTITEERAISKSNVWRSRIAQWSEGRGMTPHVRGCDRRRGRTIDIGDEAVIDEVQWVIDDRSWAEYEGRVGRH